MCPVSSSQIPGSTYVEGIGRRKTAVARVRLFPVGALAGEKGTKGEMTFLVNTRPWTAYFPMVAVQAPVKQPFEVTATWGQYDVSVHVRGGGIHAQAGAVKLGVARALEKANQEFRKPLRATDSLSRDPRKKERKKPGLKRARRAPQWAKR